MAEEEDLAREREYYESTDFADLIEEGQGEWTDEPLVRPDAMVVASFRLPLYIVHAVAKAAARRGVKVTALMREWVEAGLADELENGTVPASTIRAAIAEHLARQRPAS